MSKIEYELIMNIKISCKWYSITCQPCVLNSSPHPWMRDTLQKYYTLSKLRGFNYLKNIYFNILFLKYISKYAN